MTFKTVKYVEANDNLQQWEEELAKKVYSSSMIDELKNFASRMTAAKPIQNMPNIPVQPTPPHPLEGQADAYTYGWDIPKYEPHISITVNEYEQLLKNQKPDDWREDNVLINIETLAEALTEKMMSLLPTVEDRTVIYDEMYDLIYKYKV